jgi:hypothetical protein
MGVWLVSTSVKILIHYLEKIGFRKAFINFNVYVLVVVIIISFEKLFLKVIYGRKMDFLENSVLPQSAHHMVLLKYLLVLTYILLIPYFKRSVRLAFFIAIL